MIPIPLASRARALPIELILLVLLAILCFFGVTLIAIWSSVEHFLVSNSQKFLKPWRRIVARPWVVLVTRRKSEDSENKGPISIVAYCTGLLIWGSMVRIHHRSLLKFLGSGRPGFKSWRSRSFCFPCLLPERSEEKKQGKQKEPGFKPGSSRA